MRLHYQGRHLIPGCKGGGVGCGAREGGPTRNWPDPTRNMVFGFWSPFMAVAQSEGIPDEKWLKDTEKV